jgi:hypothetical protein
VVGVAALGGEDDQRVTIADEPSTSTTTTAIVPTTTTAPTATSVPSTTLPVTPGTTTPGGSARPGGVTGTTVPAPPATTPTTAAPASPRTQVLTSEGGTATVSWTATDISVLGTAPATGWTLEGIEQRDATRVVVRFRRADGGSGTSSASIDARVVDGQLEVH